MAEVLAEALQREMTRVRDRLLPVYDSLEGGVGRPAAVLMRSDLDRATTALAEGDVLAMLRAFESLKEWKL